MSIVCSAQVINYNEVNIISFPDRTIYLHKKHPFGVYNNNLNAYQLTAYIGDNGFIRKQGYEIYLTNESYNYIFDKLSKQLNKGKIKYKNKNKSDIWIKQKKSNNIFIGNQINNKICIDLMKELVNNPLSIEIENVYEKPQIIK